MYNSLIILADDFDVLGMRFMGSIYQTICERRSVRKFKNESISKELLLKLINAGRLAPSGANIQPCQYIIITDESLKKVVFPHLKWAAYIAPEGDPPNNERPAAYIVVLIDLNKKKKNGDVDAAAAIQNILIAAWGEKVASCWLKSINRKKIKDIFKITDNMEVDSIIALGYPNERPVVEDALESIRYWKDGDGILHVPKRKITDIVHNNVYSKDNKILLK